MADYVSMKLVLDTKEFVDKAKDASKELEKALNVKPNGDQAIIKMKADVRKLTQETAKSAEVSRKKFDEYGDAVDKLANKATRLKELDNRLKEINKDKDYKSLKDQLSAAKVEEANGFDVGGKISDLQSKIRPYEDEIANIKAESKQLNEELKQGMADLKKDAGANLGEISKQAEDFIDKGRRVNEQGKSVSAIVSEINNKQAKTNQLADEQARKEHSVADAAQKTSDATQQMVDAEKQAADESKAVNDELNKVGDSAEKAGTATEQMSEGLVDAESPADKLSDEMEEIGATTVNTQAAYSGLSGVVSRLYNVVSGLKSGSIKLSEAFAFIKARKSVGALYQRLIELNQAKRDIESNGIPDNQQRVYAAITDEISRVKEKIKSYKQDVNSTSAAHKNAEKAGKEFAKGVSGAINGLKKTMRSTGSVVKSLVRTLKTGLSPISKAIGKVKSSFDGMAHSMRSNMKHMITSITKYVLGFRSLFFLVRRLRKYIGEGIQNMAQFNDGNNHVNEGITRLLSSLLYLKNAWATAFSPIIQFVTAWLSALIDKLAEVGNAFSRFLGSILGVGTVFQAVKVDASDYAKSLDNVGGSAGGAADKTKKLTDRLAAFDDLNVLGKDNAPDSTGSGGGGGAGDLYTPDPNEMFKLVDVSDDILQKIKDMWAKADFSEIGRTFRDKLVNALNTAQENMTAFETTAYNLGKSIITFLNGALGDGTLWAEVGQTIAQGLNTLGQFVSGVLENNEVDLGGGFATLINSFLSDTDWGTVSENIKSFVETFRNNVTSFLSTLSWDDVKDSFTSLTTAIGDALVGAVSDQEFMTQLGIAVGEIINMIVGLFSNPTDTEGIKEGFTTFFTTAFDTIDWEQIKGVLKSALDTLFEALSESDNPVVKSFADAIPEIISFVTELKATFDEIKPELVSFFVELKSAITTLLPVITQIVGIIGPILSLLLPIVSSVFEPLASLIAELANTILPLIVPVLEVISPIIQQLVEAIFPVLSAILQSLQPVVESFITNILPMISSLLSHIMPLIQSISDLLVGVLGESGDLGDTLVRLTGEIFEPLFKILEPIFDILTVIFDVVGDLLEPIVALISPLLDILLMCLEPLFDNFDLIGEIIEITIVPLFKLLAVLIKVTVVPALNMIVSGLQLVQQAFGFVKTALDSLKTAWKKAWNDLRTFTNNLFNTIIGGIEGLVNGMIGGINKAIKLINSLSFTVPDWIPEIGGKSFGFTLREMSTVSLPRLAQGAVIPPNKEFMAVLGDQSHGTNIEAPLDTIKQAVAEVLANNGNQEVIDLLQQLITVVEHKNLTIGDKEIGKATARYNTKQMRLRGTSF